MGTELAPAISLAYEGAERDIMKKPPRKRGARLVSRSLLLYSYVFAGLLISFGATLAYLSVYWSVRRIAKTALRMRKRNPIENF